MITVRLHACFNQRYCFVQVLETVNCASES